MVVVVVVAVGGRGGAVSENSRVFQQCRQWGTKNTGSRELHSPKSPWGVVRVVVATCAVVVVTSIVRIRVIRSRSTGRSVSSVRIVANGRFHARGG